MYAQSLFKFWFRPLRPRPTSSTSWLTARSNTVRSRMSTNRPSFFIHILNAWKNGVKIVRSVPFLLNKVRVQNIIFHTLEWNQSFFQTWEVYVLYSICQMLYRIPSKFLPFWPSFGLEIFRNKIPKLNKWWKYKEFG